jgi:hypothetical protein
MKYQRNPGGYEMKLADRVNYAREINFVLNELWTAGGKRELKPVALTKFVEGFKPSNMKPTAPADFKKRTGLFWESMIYKISQKVKISN